MTKRLFYAILLALVACTSQSDNSKLLSPEQVKEDLDYFDNYLQQHASYVDLNGYSYQEALQKFSASIDDNGVSQTELGLFLSNIVGRLGDRHAYAKRYNLPNTKFLPFVAAPLDDQVVGLVYDREQRQYNLLHERFPYLKAINGIPIKDFLSRICLKDQSAPELAYHTRAVRRLKYMEENYAIMQEALPETFEFTFTNHQMDTLVRTSLEAERSKHITWEDKIVRQYGQQREELNKPELISKLFDVDDNGIGYIRMPDMVHPEDAPLYFDSLNAFMARANEHCAALIIDIRGNGGGTRHLIWELAKYTVHPDSIVVANAARQRATLPLNEERREDLNNRGLFAFDNFDEREKEAIHRFNADFRPMYGLDDSKFSEFHYMLFNGSKNDPKHYFDKPVYILGNEKCFSAASVLIAVFKGMRNVAITGMTSDGSSGNSEKFRLPNSEIKVKISTMVSFQKDGKILDGYGTEPDLKLARNLDQVLWKSDFQLEELKRIILTN